jgi:hypothetical protein
MEYFQGTKIQISPCIAAKAKFALKITTKKPANTKKCSYTYWCKVIDTYFSNNHLSAKIAQAAKNEYKRLIK